MIALASHVFMVNGQIYIEQLLIKSTRENTSENICIEVIFETIGGER